MGSVFIDARRGVWWVKWKGPDGWRRDKLGKHPSPFPPGKPPKKAPPFIDERAAPYLQRERDARGGTGSPETGLAGYMHGYLESFAASHPPTSIACMDRFVGTFLEFCKGRKVDSLQSVTKQVCRDYLEHRLKSVAASSVKTERDYLGSPFSRAVDDELIPASPWKGVKPPAKVKPSEPVFWTGEEVDAIADAMTQQWHADLVRFMANTGLRVSAALAAEFSWVDITRGVIAVPADDDKGGKGYEIPMTAVARAVIESRRVGSKSPYVFAKPDGGKYGYSGFVNALSRAVRKAGVRVGTPHDLRHTFARSLCKAGVPINVVQRALGHSSLAMTQRYTDVTAETARTYLDGFSVGGKPTPSNSTE